MDRVKRGVKSWLEIEPAREQQIRITETMDFEANAAKNRIWYSGLANELQELYSQIDVGVDKYKFWASKSTPGMEIRKIHTGLPALIVDTISNITLTDLNEFEFMNNEDKDIWEEIDRVSRTEKKLERALKETLYLGGGAFKLSFDPEIASCPIIEWYPADRIDLEYKRGVLREVIFKTPYTHDRRKYCLLEHYGYGYIHYELLDEMDRPVDLEFIPETAGLLDVTFGGRTEDMESQELASLTGQLYMLAVPLTIFESGKWEGRGQSIFDHKIDAFDSLDETWSQWMDALRAGRAKEYIPEGLLPRDPRTGAIMRPNHFDNRFIRIENNMAEGAQNKIDVEQPVIPHESYLSSYVTALDLCLQGIISPSTLGIDVKKLDNADAQREKEKTTLYTRQSVIDALQEDIPQLIRTAVRACREWRGMETKEVQVNVTFGEYANPSFEAQVETVAKAKTQGIMSVEASVEELYGDTKEKEWKEAEVARIKAEQGIETIEEPAAADDLMGFHLDLTGGEGGNA